MRLKHQNLFARILMLSVACLTALCVWDGSLVNAQRAGEPSRVSSSPSSSNPARKHPFEPTEELVYVAEFSRALLKKVDVADFRFTASKQPALEKVSLSTLQQQRNNGPYLLKFTGDVSSKGFFSKLFNLRFREQIESIVDPTSFTVQKTKRIDEQGKRARISETTYTDGKVIWTERDPNNPSRPQRKAEAAFAGRVQDVLSAIYYLRTQPLEVGRSFDITVSDSGAVYQVPVQVIEKRRKKTVLGRVEAIRVDPQVFGPDRLLDGDGQFSIWITNDSRRIPVSARIKMRYGTFDITLRKVTQQPAAQESLASVGR
ncbi:MAG TPA: DUF3108 domain-containing protein [Pyrinomonadaceae bacterium]|nr:DUF3108 domain-containing protein [Pyrinomonadaceae bacterium]